MSGENIMSKEIDDFRKEMKRAFIVIEGKAEKTVKNAFIEMFSGMIDDTPVGDPALWNRSSIPKGYVPGTLKANWQTQSGSSPSSFLPEVKDQTGSATISNMKTKVMSWDFNKETLYFQNNAPYAETIEFGHSSQAPQGMYRLNVAKYNGLISKYARKEDK